jgi:hypothetical protein
MKTEAGPLDSPFRGSPDAKASVKFSDFPHFKSLRTFVAAAEAWGSTGFVMARNPRRDHRPGIVKSVCIIITWYGFHVDIA